MPDREPIEQFRALAGLAGLVHVFTQRVPGIDVQADKAEALRRLDARHREIRKTLGLGAAPFVSAQQVHGSRVATADEPITADICFDDCDGLITNQAGVCLGIYVADCCAVYIVDRVRRAI